jgi:shikimate dehydrogenase
MLDVFPLDLSTTIQNISQDYVGVNVTLPHKESILAYLQKVTPAAEAIGAVNVVHFEGKKATGHNTDVEGLLGTFREHKISLAGESVLIIGAGGAARAMAYAAALSKVSEINFAARNVEKAKKISESIGPLFPKVKWNLEPRSSHLIVNTTPVGMVGISGENAFASHLSFTKKNSVALDLIYRPSDTPFLKLAREKDFKTVGGLDMLIYQALATWKIWFGELKNPAALKKALVPMLKAQLELA